MSTFSFDAQTKTGESYLPQWLHFTGDVDKFIIII